MIDCMLRARAGAELKVLVDHTSSHGAAVTHMRGMLLVKSVENLRKAGLFERYAVNLTPKLREQIEFTLAASWVSVDICEAHYAACDRLALSESEIERLGEMMGEDIGGTMMSVIIKTTRGAGVESTWAALKQCGRFWDRAYQGGGVTLLQAGPKDSVMEFHGLPLAKSRHWRMGSRAFWLGLSRLTARTAYVKLVRPREPDPNRVAIAGSWV
jgi:hypothetical protein